VTTAYIPHYPIWIASGYGFVRSRSDAARGECRMETAFS
jgi:hypothetical protein